MDARQPSCANTTPPLAPHKIIGILDVRATCSSDGANTYFFLLRHEARRLYLHDSGQACGGGTR
jgi:hypothetical protein